MHLCAPLFLFAYQNDSCRCESRRKNSAKAETYILTEGNKYIVVLCVFHFVNMNFKCVSLDSSTDLIKNVNF